MSLAFPTASNTLFPLISRSRCQRALGFYDVLPKEQHQRNGNLVPCRVDQEDPDTESYYQLSKFKRKEQGWEHSPFLCKPRAESCLLVLHPLRNVPAHTDCQVSLEFMQSIIPVKKKNHLTIWFTEHQENAYKNKMIILTCHAMNFVLFAFFFKFKQAVTRLKEQMNAERFTSIPVFQNISKTE